MCDEDGCNCDMKSWLTICFCFKLCCDASQNTSRGGLSASNDDEKPLKGPPVDKEMSRFKF